MSHTLTIGQTDYSRIVFIPDPASTDGSGKTGLVAANLTVSYTRVETDNDVVTVDVTSSLNDLASLTSAHADWGIKEVSSSLAPGLYRIDLADAVFAAGAWTAVVYIMITTSAASAAPMEFILVAHNPFNLGVAQTGDSGVAGAGLTAVPWNSAWDAEVQSEVEDALVAQNLDHLVKIAVDTNFATTVHADSVIGQLADNGAGFDRSTDSLEAIRDRGDAAWDTATGFSTHSAADVWAVGTRALTILDEDSTTLDLDATIRAAVGLASANLDTQLGATALEATSQSILADTGTDGVVVAASSKTGYAIGVGGISAAAFAAGAIDNAAIAADAIGASELAASAANEIADALLARNVAGGSSTGRIVSEALYALRNRCAIATGTLTVYAVDDATPSWTAAVTTAAGDPLSEIDPT